MEDPGTWGKTELVVDAVLTDHYRQRAEDALQGEFHCGLSLARKITDALRAESLLCDKRCLPVAVPSPEDPRGFRSGSQEASQA